MIHLMTSLLALLLVIVSIAQTAECAPFCIHAVQGRDSAACLNETDPEHQICCKSLAYLVEGVTTNHTPLTFNISVKLQTNITLSRIISFRDFNRVRSVKITGETAIVITCEVTESREEKSAGFYFKDIHSLWIENLTFDGCATLQNSTSRDPENSESVVKFPTSLYILNCTDVTLLKLTIRNTQGTGLAIYDTDGTVRVIGCKFENNILPDSSKYSGGGGAYIEFSKCSPHGRRYCNKNSNYLIENCIFVKNEAQTTRPGVTLFQRNTKNEFQGFGRGGGLCLFLRGESKSNTFTILNCTFQANLAHRGAGLFIMFKDKVSNNLANISRTTFKANHCKHVGGGGAQVGFLSYDHEESQYLSNNNIYFEHSRFIENEAERFGGGVYILSSREYSKRVTSNNFAFTNCTWLGNKAVSASAVDASPGIWDSLTRGILPSPVFTDCSFTGNVIAQSTKSLAEGVEQRFSKYGAFLATNFRIILRGQNKFVNNQGTALYLITSRLILDENAELTFLNNTAERGGALVMIAFSILLIKANTTIHFEGNQANSKGGAIYIESIDIHEHTSSRSCFIQYNGNKTINLQERNVIISFHQNKAKSGDGHSIYATSLKSCFNQCRTQQNKTFLAKSLGCITNIEQDNKSNPQLDGYNIATSYFEFTSHGDYDFESIIPGGYMTLPVRAIDELYQEKNNMVYHATVANNSNVSVDHGSSHFSNSQIQLKGEPQSKGTLVVSKGPISVLIAVQLTDCPPGYAMENNQCKCKSLEYTGIWNCSSQNRAHVLQGYWVGKCKNGDLCTAACPRSYCSYIRAEKRDYLLPTNLSELEDYTCGPTRKGVLCGKCRTNYTVQYHSYNHKCGDTSLCNVGILLYIVSDIIPLTVIFILVIVFNISFTSGIVNSFIFFTQVIDSLDLQASDIIQTSPAITTLTICYQFIYRIFSMDFFRTDSTSYCIWRNATNMDIMAMKYVTILYALGLIFLTVGVMNSRIFQRCGFSWKKRNLRSTVVHGLTAFFVMCYSESAKASFYILSSTHLFSRGSVAQEFVVFRSGHMHFFQGEHIKYAIPAVICLFTLVALPPILLIAYPLGCKILARCGLGESKIAYTLSRLVPMQLLDSFQSCFKDKYRFFSGFFFLYRLFPLVIHIFIRTHQTSYYLLVELQLIVILTLHSLIQPYKKYWHNIVDILILANLAIINLFTMYNYERATERQDVPDKGFATKTEAVLTIQVLLIFLPLVYILSYVTQNTVRKVLAWYRKQTKNKETKDQQILLDSCQLPPLREQMEHDYQEYNDW